MKLIILVCSLSLLFTSSLSRKHFPAAPNAEITVMGLVYCDVCSNNSFSRHSYFMPGVKVRIDCKFKAAASRTREQIVFTANRTTNEHGLYRLDITSLDGVACSDAGALASSCQASLIGSSSDSCKVPGFRTTTDQIAFDSKRSNLCVYGFNALNFRPFKLDPALCGKQ